MCSTLRASCGRSATGSGSILTCRGRAPDPSRCPAECVVSLLPVALPAVAWQRIAPGFLPRLRERLLYAALNYGVMLRLLRCDVFICMSGIYLEAARFARRRYGARVWLERGSRHILSQDRILAAIDGAERPSRFTVRRELAGYEMADRIVVPSRHVAESFAVAPDLGAKLFRNPTGSTSTCFRRDRRRNCLNRLRCFMSGHGLSEKVVICWKKRYATSRGRD